MPGSCQQRRMHGPRVLPICQSDRRRMAPHYGCPACHPCHGLLKVTHRQKDEARFHDRKERASECAIDVPTQRQKRRRQRAAADGDRVSEL